ncbi:hypothetical protein [Mesorhizobium sp. WSM3860]|uniref:hypothetical protein n=1 Tax=Mesorhizobium sp. WSM3860 TaxID=2029403 RepID=UPI000BB0A663|nr:hypothetical protein [Mesorhizobium sp. WSM3860]PBC06286.1 hypothetical protein CK220_03880 [Mesorhizobium sp. WSM3860]
MKSAFRYLMFAAALLSLTGMDAGQAADAPMPLFVATPRELSTTSTSKTTVMSRVNGRSATVLHVNPTKPGLHAVLLRLEPTHHAAVAPRFPFATTQSGTFYVAFGDTYDETKLKALPPGGIYTEPA